VIQGLQARARTAERVANATLVGLVATLGVTAVVAFVAVHSALDWEWWIEHTLEVEKKLAVLSSSVWEFDSTSQAGRTIPRQESNHGLEPEKTTTRGLLEQVAELTRDNASQRRRMSELRRALAQEMEGASRSPQSSADTQTLIAEMMDEEDRLLVQRDRLGSAATLRATLVAGILSLLMLLTIGLAIIFMRKGTRSRQGALAAVQQSEEDLATTLSSIGDAVIATDTTGRIMRLNPVAERLTGWAAGAAIGMPLGEVFRIVDETTRIVAPNPTERILREGVVTGLGNHAVLVNKDGTDRHIAESGASIRDSSGNVRGVVLVFRDLTKELAARNALRHSETRFARLSESGIVGIAIADVVGGVSEANEAYLMMLGYSREDLLAGRMRWTEVTRLESQKADEQALESLKTRGVAPPWEKELIRKDGSRLSVLMGVAMLDYPNSIVFTVDLTERKKIAQALSESQEQFRQAQKMEAIGRLAGGIAHDFNNLLSVILMYAEMAIPALAPNEPLRKDLEEIMKAGQRAATLTRQLLAFSRQQVLELKVIDLNELIAGIGKMLGRVIGEDIELSLRPARALGSVRGDPGQIEQVLMNLAVNARDAMSRGGKLTIETANVALDEEYAHTHLGVEAGPYVMLAVSDTGIGMDKALQARIFEPFFTTKEMGKGTGLGLSTVFGIVQQSKGHIWIYSEPGKGTTFKVYLPRTDEPITPSASEVDMISSLHGTETILLVEDEEQIRNVILSFLRGFGYHVLEARNGGEGLLIAEKHPGEIDLLLTDVVMPHMSGAELIKRVASVRPDMKVLCMSGYTDETILTHGILDAGLAFLQKPITSNKLAHKIRVVLATEKVDAEEARL